MVPTGDGPWLAQSAFLRSCAAPSSHTEAMPDHGICSRAESRTGYSRGRKHRSGNAHPSRWHHCEARRCARCFCVVARLWNRGRNSGPRSKLRRDGPAIASSAHGEGTYQSGAGTFGRVESSQPFPNRKRRSVWRRYHRANRQSPRSVARLARLWRRADGAPTPQADTLCTCNRITLASVSASDSLHRHQRFPIPSPQRRGKHLRCFSTEH